MKKLLFLVVLGLFLAPLAKADVPDNVYFLGDGVGYNVNGDQMYYCFLDGSCYSVEGVFAFVRQTQTILTDLQKQVTSLQNQVATLQNQPVQTPSAVADTVAPAVDTTAPKLLGIKYSTCSSSSYCYAENQSSTLPGLENFGYGATAYVGITLKSDEPTTAKFNFYPYNPALKVAEQDHSNPITVNLDSSTIHTILYQNVPLASGTPYNFDFTLTDSAGNTSTFGYDSIRQPLYLAEWK